MGKGMGVLTGVVRDYKAAGKDERALLRKQNAAMDADMTKAITWAINEGEARANAIGQRARASLKAAKQSMLVEITNRVEDMADMTFKTIQGGHQKIADNYLSFKAYAVTAKDKIQDYVAKGKGKNLSSLGSLLTTVGAMSHVKVTKEEGLSPSKVLPAPFSGSKVTIDNSISKINGQVDKVSAHSGNFVFINGHAVGLSNKLNDFEWLA